MLSNLISFSKNEKIENIEDVSEITQFFTGCNVLITGGSGFVGKLLIEKLLRSCPKISKIYILLRAKKGKSSQERFKEQFEDVVYDRLKSEQPEYATKIRLIEGGLDERGISLSPEDRKLVKDTHVIFHGAATVRFDDALRFATNINVRGTKEILLLAREMPNLKAVVHVGTAFSMCVNKFIDEVFYKSPIGADELLTLVDILDDATLSHLTPKLMGNWPNTYAFTKTVGEDAVLKYSEGLPVCIVRPSIMIPTAKDPIPGWINNIYGAIGVGFASGMGILRTLHCNSDYVAEMIPADYVINNIVAAAWNVGTQRRINPTRTLQSSNPEERQDEPLIYNCVTSCQNPTTWGDYSKYGALFGKRMPSIAMLWYQCLTLNKNYSVHLIYMYLFHFLPALIIDALLLVSGRKPQLLKVYKKVHKFMDVISYFATQQWKFRNENVMKLWDGLSPIDKKIYFFHVGDIQWIDYYSEKMKGMRKYLMNDPMDTLPVARKRYFRMKIAHYSLLTLASVGLLWLAYYLLVTFVSFLISFCPYFNN